MKRKNYFFLIFSFFILNSCYVFGQAKPTKEQVEKGYNYLETQVYSQEENLKLIKLFEGPNVSDVSDAMDFVGLVNTGLVDPAIHPAWVDPTPARKHYMVGIAVTCRYLPTQRVNRPEPGEDFGKWSGRFYSVYSPETFTSVLFKGAVVVREGFLGKEDSGIGSNNILAWVEAGAVGVLTNATSRDVDEIMYQKVPLYYHSPGRGFRPGRSELESVNRPVNIGGVTVFPGDVIVADGDGVIVVPRKVAFTVGERAQRNSQSDAASRKKRYERLGIPLDATVPK